MSSAMVERREAIAQLVTSEGSVTFGQIKKAFPDVSEMTLRTDLKALDDEVHARYTGVSNRRILESLEFLARSGACVNVRVPVVHPVNDSEEALAALASYVTKRVGTPRVSLLPYHTTGAGKYRRLGADPAQGRFEVPGAAHMERLRQVLAEHGLSDVEIGG